MQKVVGQHPVDQILENPQAWGRLILCRWGGGPGKAVFCLGALAQKVRPCCHLKSNNARREDAPPKTKQKHEFNQLHTPAGLPEFPYSFPVAPFGLRPRALHAWATLPPFLGSPQKEQGKP
jgi:hypothetical protein